MELKTLELKTIDYQIDEVPEDGGHQYSVGNDSDLFKVENAYFNKPNKNETLKMNEFSNNFGQPNSQSRITRLSMNHT